MIGRTLMQVDITAKAKRRSMLALWPYVLIVAFGAALLLPRLGAFGLWDPWEPKYAQSAREMLERGTLVVPYFLDEVRLTGIFLHIGKIL